MFIPSLVAPSAPHRRLWFVVHPRGLVAVKSIEGVRLPDEAELALLGARVEDAHYLGELDGEHAYALSVTERPPEPFSALNFRGLYGSVSEDMFAVVGRATHVVDWATTNKFCGRCGSLNLRTEGERAMKCTHCDLTSYPRISPAIITLVRRGEEALLAQGSRFPAAFYSTLAGFSEIGESLEETLAREVKEEVGVEVGNIRYFGSQPWPFPNSLMIGFTADWVSGEISIDKKEILDARWFRADDLPMIPPRLSIARRLIDGWVADVTGSSVKGAPAVKGESK